MNRLSLAARLGAAVLVALTGCDPALSDPNVARIDAASLAAAPPSADGAPVFVRLTTPWEVTDTEPSAGVYPVSLATAEEVGVMTTDGVFDGEVLAVEVRRCGDTCDTSEVIGQARVEPESWRGSSKTVDAGGAAVTLLFRKTSS